MLNNLLKPSNIAITKATGRVKGNIDPNITHSSVQESKNLYNREAVSPHSNIYPKIPKIIQHQYIFYNDFILKISSDQSASSNHNLL